MIGRPKHLHDAHGSCIWVHEPVERLLTLARKAVEELERVHGKPMVHDLRDELTAVEKKLEEIYLWKPSPLDA